MQQIFIRKFKKFCKGVQGLFYVLLVMAKPYKAYNTLKSSRPEKIKPVRVYLIFWGKKLLQPPKATKSFALASGRALRKWTAEMLPEWRRSRFPYAEFTRLREIDSRAKVFPLHRKIARFIGNALVFIMIKKSPLQRRGTLLFCIFQNGFLMHQGI